MRKTSTFARKRRAGHGHHANPIAAFSLLDQARPFDENDSLQHLIVGLVRAEDIDPLLVATMNLGIGAMVRMQQRVMRGLSFGFDADGLRDVPYALEAYEAILVKSSPLQMKLAIQEAWRRVTGGDVLEVH
jgi:hypothetical protein